MCFQTNWIRSSLPLQDNRTLKYQKPKAAKTLTTANPTIVLVQVDRVVQVVDTVEVQADQAVVTVVATEAPTVAQVVQQVQVQQQQVPKNHGATANWVTAAAVHPVAVTVAAAVDQELAHLGKKDHKASFCLNK